MRDGKNGGQRKNRLTPPSPSLKQSALRRMLIITVAAVLIFYGIGLAVNQIGIRNVRNDMQDALRAQVEYAASQAGQDLERLKFFATEMASDKQVVRFAISHPVLTEWERQSYIRSIAAQEYLIKRASSLVDTVRIMFPSFDKTILTEQAEYVSLDREMWDGLYPLAEKGRVTLGEWGGSRWILLLRMDGKNPLFLIAFSVSPASLEARLESLENERAGGLALCRADGSVLAAGRDAEAFLPDPAASGEDLLRAEAPVPGAGLTLRGYSLVDWAMEPFLLYRRILWILTALALGVLGAYIWYAMRHIFRPLNELSASMRQVEQDGRYRMETRGNQDYNDLYAQFNHMVDHLERLTGQVYEEQYRAQQAELKQLQMQIDPHFLYNSLYLIYRMAQAGGNRDIAHLSMNLSNYYRYITKMPEQVVRLRDEIGHVMNYLEIQRVRFSPRIRVEAEPLPEEIADEEIPSLIIQPIVENAFQHGVRDLDRDGLIRLCYRTEENHFRVIVSDNSGKMTPEKVEALWDRLRNPAEGEAGALWNLYRRLQLYEGMEQVLQLECADGGLQASLIFQRKGKKG
ncbi:MAG: histidine kinase [Clostridia bacterium]|nr:histidine kinase [Clostridia bacterium]